MEGEPRLEGSTPRAVEYSEEQRSSVKYARNAKGDTQVEVKAYDGITQAEMTDLQKIAFNTYKDAVEAAGLLVS